MDAGQLSYARPAGEPRGRTQALLSGLIEGNDVERKAQLVSGRSFSGVAADGSPRLFFVPWGVKPPGGFTVRGRSGHTACALYASPLD